MNEGRKLHRIPTREKYQIVLWLQANRERLEKNSTPYQVAADEVKKPVAEGGLGIDCNGNHIRRLAKELGLTWGPGYRDTNGQRLSGIAAWTNKISREVEALTATDGILEGAIRRIESKIDIVNGLLNHLYGEMRLKPPSGIHLPLPR